MSETEVGLAFRAALERLTKYLGTGDAAEVMEQSLRLSRVSSFPKTPDELYRVGLMLEEHPIGMAAQVGIALKVKALLLGAAEAPGQ